MVRSYVGYDRLDTVAQTHMLNRLYQHLWLYNNFFQPVMRLNRKTFSGTPGELSRVKRGYDHAQTPFDRLCATSAIAPADRLRLHALCEHTNPRQLRNQIYALLDQLHALPPAIPGVTQNVFETLDISAQKGEDMSVTFSFDSMTCP